MSDSRVFNFSAGPATLPIPVLERARDELVEFPGAGMSVMEMSHRSKVYDAIHHAAMDDLRTLLNVPDNYHILFLQGGATTQFSMIPMNLLGDGLSADYIVTGAWSKKAYDEAVALGYDINLAASTKDSKFTTLPSEYNFNPKASYVHFCQNETIHGVEYESIPPGVPAGVPIVADVSSNILSKPLDISQYGMLYGGAQKNIGPAGVTIVIIRDDLIRKDLVRIPLMMKYATHADPKKPSLYNTPPTYGIYVAGLVFKHLLELGGVPAVLEHNLAKADMLYCAIEGSDGYYTCPVEAHCRSRMNVPFRVCCDPELEALFIAEAAKANLVNLKGHRSIGGCRASIYNAMTLEGVQALVDFMATFKDTHPKA